MAAEGEKVKNRAINTELTGIIKSIKGFIESERNTGIAEFWTKSIEGTRLSKKEQLSLLHKEVAKCRNCDLNKTRKNIVFGDGNPDAQLFFIGEAPGMEEDIQGLPFVGQAGKLLTKIIEAIGLKREEVYIGNVLKCRPPGNRSPLPTEIQSCGGYLLKQIEIVGPRVICALGNFASKAILKTEISITKLRGKFIDYRQGIKFMPTFHPAYLLRNPDAKKLMWEDMKRVRDYLLSRK